MIRMAVPAAPSPAASPVTARIVQPGRNCWHVDRASRFYCIQDAADYFRIVRQAVLNARKSVFSLGWDISAHTDLDPLAAPSEVPTRLDQVLAYAARRRPELRCYLLTWDYGALYTLERDPLTRWRLGWRMPRGVRLGFDDHHPLGGSHHQKVIVVDDQLAFCGGIDLTGHRWDTSAHRPDEPARTTALGKAYGPYHEVQAMMTGPAAARLGELARDRWRALGVERMPPLHESPETLWPSDLTPDLTDVDVAIARTLPGTESRPAVRECEALFADSIARAARTIYIESQYFTDDDVASALAARLRERDGPEIVIVSPRVCEGWLERRTMGEFREVAFRKLIAADEYRRLRLVFPLASRSRDVPTFVHSKVMVIDDELVRIGSANLARRSMGVDSECDVAVDAGGDDRVRDGIRRIRNRLLAEHLGLSVEDVARGLEHSASVGALIDSRAHAEHTLARIELAEPATPPSETLQAAADPDEPVALGSSGEFPVPALDATSMGNPLRLWILPALVVTVAAALSWRFSVTLDSIPATSPGLLIGTGLFVAAGLLLMPLELLAIACGVGFGALGGGLVAILGSLVVAGIGYMAGRALGPARLPRWMSRRSYRSVRQLGARGVTGLVVLRLASVASAGSIHLMCGAARVPFTTFMAATLLGLMPAVAALAGLGGLLRVTLLEPSTANGLITIGAAALLFVLALGLRIVLLMRQFGPAVAGHRSRAEFG